MQYVLAALHLEEKAPGTRLGAGSPGALEPGVIGEPVLVFADYSAFFLMCLEFGVATCLWVSIDNFHT